MTGSMKVGAFDASARLHAASASRNSALILWHLPSSSLLPLLSPCCTPLLPNSEDSSTRTLTTQVARSAALLSDAGLSDVA